MENVDVGGAFHVFEGSCVPAALQKARMLGDVARWHFCKRQLNHVIEKTYCLEFQTAGFVNLLGAFLIGSADLGDPLQQNGVADEGMIEVAARDAAFSQVVQDSPRYACRHSDDHRAIALEDLVHSEEPIPQTAAQAVPKNGFFGNSKILDLKLAEIGTAQTGHFKAADLHLRQNCCIGDHQLVRAAPLVLDEDQTQIRLRDRTDDLFARAQA